MALKVKRNTREVEEIPLSSTADIAFLLIVFFLAASALLEFRGIRIPLPKKDAPPMQILRKNLFKVYVKADGSFAQDGSTVTLDQLSERMQKAYASNAELIVAIRVEGEAPSDRVPMLVRRVQDAGILRLSIGMEEK